MIVSERKPVAGMGLAALALVLSTGAALAQSYQNLGSYDQWELQFGVRVGPSVPAPLPLRPEVYVPPFSAPPVVTPLPAYRPPRTIYVQPPRYAPPQRKPDRQLYGDGRDDTILYDRSGRIIGTRDPGGRTRPIAPPVSEPGNDDFDFQRDGRGRDGWSESDDIDDDARPDDRDFTPEPGNEAYDAQGNRIE